MTYDPRLFATLTLDSAPGLSRKLYFAHSPEQLNAEAADFKRRVFQLSFDPAADRRARAAQQEVKEARSSMRYDKKPAAEVPVEAA